MIYEFAAEKDLGAIRNLLEACDLPTNDLEGHLNHFIIAKQENCVVGCIGLEPEGPLLRSLAVDPGYRDQGIARNLCERLLTHAKQENAKEIYLLTTTASKFFDKIGFHQRNREEAPETIRGNKQFTELCPSTAVLMWRKL